MKHVEKIFIVLIILAPLVWGYVALQPYLRSEDDMIADIISSDSQGDKANDKVEEDIQNIIDETPQSMEGEEYISKIGNPIGKIISGGEINISVANIYSEADENSEIVDTINKYSVVTSQAYPNGWSRVKNDTVSGWMKSEHITLPEGSENATIGSVIGRKGTVNVDSLNMRKSASTGAARITSLTLGTEVTILSISNDDAWYQVKYGANEGWVAKQYITVK